MTFIATRRSTQSRLWTPKDLGPGLSLWLDGYDPSTIIVNGSTVSQWRDKSVYGNHVSQPTSSNQPLNLSTPAVQNSAGYLYNNSPNGLPIGTTDRTLVIVEMTYSGRHSNEYMVLYGGSGKNYDGSNAQNQFGIGSYCEGTNSNSVGNGSSQNYQVYNGAQAYGPFNSIIAIYNSIQLTTLTASNQNISISQSGTNVFSGSMPYATTSGPLSIFNDSTVSQAFQGQLYGVFLANTAEQKVVTRLEGFAAWRYGLVGNLPAAHPYKLQPPRANV